MAEIKDLPMDLGAFHPGSGFGTGADAADILSSNSYLITSEKRCLLVDPARNERTLNFTLDWITKKQLNLRWIVLTHYHPDHIENAQKIREILGASVICHDSELFLIKKSDAELNDYTIENQYGRSLRCAYREISWPDHQSRRHQKQITDGGVEVDSTVADGDSVRVGGLEVSFLHTPGHTPGSLTVYLPQSGAVFPGDLTLWMGPGQPHPLGDYSDWLKSLYRLQQLQPQVIAWGHSFPTSGSRRCDRFLRRIIERSQQLKKIITGELKGQGSTIQQVTDIVKQQARGISSDHRRLMEGSVHSIIHELYSRGEVHRIQQSGCVKWRIGASQ